MLHDKGMQGWFDIQRSIYIIHHIYQLKKTPYDHLKREKAFDTNQHPFLIKYQQTRHRRELSQPQKSTSMKNL